MAIRILILTILLSSCSAQWHLDRALKKDPNIISFEDTIIWDTTIVTESWVEMDTLIMQEVDTITLYDSITKIETHIIRNNDTFYITRKSAPDTIRISKTIVPKPRKTIYIEKGCEWIKILPFIIIGIIISITIRRLWVLIIRK